MVEPSASLAEKQSSSQDYSCPLCGGNQSQLFDRRRFRGFEVTNRICRRCGLVYQYPRMSDAELEAFYEDQYRQLYQGNPDPGQDDLAVQAARAEALLDFVKRSRIQFSRHLDIGSSAGLLLERFGAAFGSQKVGVEPGRAYREYAARRGVQTYASLEELRRAGEAKFDLVTMAHVLEHLPDPVGYLKGMRGDFLTQDGCLMVEVPNLYAHDCFEVAHLVSFSRHTLRQVLRRAGFRVVRIEEHGRPRSKRLPLYTTLLAQPGDEHGGVIAVAPEYGVALKRKGGMLRRRLNERLFPRQAWLAPAREG